MCLILNLNFAKTEKAEQNLPCYKSLLNDGSSEHMGFPYNKNQLYVTGHSDILPIGQDYHSDIIDHAFHSRIPSSNLSKRDKTHLFVIPSNAHYVRGGENELPATEKDCNNYASDMIIYAGRNNWWNRYWAGRKYNVKFT